MRITRKPQFVVACILRQHLRLKMKRIEVSCNELKNNDVSLFCKLKVMKKEMFIDSQIATVSNYIMTIKKYDQFLSCCQ